MTATQPWSHLGSGSAFLIGGEANQCYDLLIHYLGGPGHAKILILTHASDLPDSGRTAAHKFWRRGVPDDHIEWSGLGSPVEIPSDFNCIFFCGGDQRRIMMLSQADQHAIKKFLQSGGMLAGSSAGVPVFSQLMIASGSPLMVDCALNYGPGLNIIPGHLFRYAFYRKDAPPEDQNSHQSVLSISSKRHRYR